MHANPQTPAAVEPPTQRVKIDTWLHRTYFRSSGVHYFVFRRLRPEGIALGLVFILATCLGIGHERGSIYQLFSLSFAMMMIGLPWALLRRAKLEAVREVPRYATQGEPVRYA